MYRINEYKKQLKSFVMFSNHSSLVEGPETALHEDVLATGPAELAAGYNRFLLIAKALLQPSMPESLSLSNAICMAIKVVER